MPKLTQDANAQNYPEIWNAKSMKSFPLRFLSLAKVIRIHDELLNDFDGGLPGIKDRNLLESSVGAPLQGMNGFFFHKTPYEMAAALYYSLAKNHGFHDGNKRTASMCTYVFLRYNGIQLELSEDELVQLTLDVANGVYTKMALAITLEKNCRLVDSSQT